jgi:hypothetical protein
MTGVGLGVGVSGVFVRMMAGMVYLVMVVFFVVSVVRYFSDHAMSATITMTVTHIMPIMMMSSNMRFFLYRNPNFRMMYNIITLDTAAASAAGMMTLMMSHHMDFLLGYRIAGY